MSRLAKVFALLVIGMVALFIIRQQLTPTSFGLYGSYRGDDVSAQMSRPVSFIGAQACQACHQAKYDTLTSSVHGSISCETCHGPGTPHIQEGVSLAVEDPRALCSKCHAALPSRPSSFPQVDVVAHAGELQCTACHNPHSPAFWEVSSQGSTATATPTPEATAKPAGEQPSAGPTPIPTPQSGGAPGATATPTPVPTSVTGLPPAIPHSLEGRADCLLCHGVGKIKPYPESHVGRPSTVCTACHNVR